MSEWQDIATAPKDGTRVDLWAKCWLPHNDSFAFKRFPDCYWMKSDSYNGSGWINIDDKTWYATHWMPLPAPPLGGQEPQ